jgi:anti-sigma regulatory factor (Ser/Thr protein kinase)
MATLSEYLAGLRESLQGYHFELRHLTLLLVVLIVFQLAVSFVHRSLIHNFLTQTQHWYQQDSAERLANLTTTSLELLLESKPPAAVQSGRDARRMIQGFNIIFSQQLLHQNVQEVCLLVDRDSAVSAIDDGKSLYDFLFRGISGVAGSNASHAAALAMYDSLRRDLHGSEQIRTIVEGGQTFHTFVPFVPRGEFVGALYMKNTPDFGFISRDLISSYGQTAATYFALILFGLIAMYYISSYTLRERNEAQQMLFDEQKKHLAEQINYQNELLFAKRIYHTHHKAEKIMGFIKEDLRNLDQANTEEIKHRITKYSNFIARVIYDMKWYAPPLQAIRGPLFKTDINEVLRFLVRNVFQRVSDRNGVCAFDLSLDTNVPPMAVNEFVAWENCVEHAGVAHPLVTIRTAWDAECGRATVTIADNGGGIAPSLLERDDQGVRRIFHEHTTTKRAESVHSGYGCYIAHEIATQRCGWTLDVENREGGGCQFTFTLPAMVEAT